MVVGRSVPVRSRLSIPKRVGGYYEPADELIEMRLSTQGAPSDRLPLAVSFAVVSATGVCSLTCFSLTLGRVLETGG